jgi:hypothetical protein
MTSKTQSAIPIDRALGATLRSPCVRSFYSFFAILLEPLMTALMNERSSASAAIRRVMEAFELVRDRDAAEVAHARSALTRHIEQLVAAGETDEERLAVAGIIYLRSLPTAEAV